MGFIYVTMSSPRTELRPILLVEDDLDDSFILSRLVQRSGARNPLQILQNGEDALRVLAKVSEGTVFQPPAAILTDLRMPKIDGFSLISWIREQHSLDNVFVAVVTLSDLRYDVRRAFDLGCNAYIRKYPSAQDCALLLAAAESFAKTGMSTSVPGLTRDYVNH